VREIGKVSCSLEHLALLDRKTVGGGLLSDSAPEVADELAVSLVADVELASLVVLELGVVNHLLRDALSAEEPDTLNLEVGLLAKDSGVREGIGSELVVHALEEAVHEVGGLVKQLTLALILLVVHEVDRVALRVVVIEEVLHSLSGFLVTEVHEVGLEVGQHELAGRKEIQRVLSSGLLFALLVVTSGLLGSGSGCLNLLLLLLSNVSRLETLLGELGVSDAGNNLRVLDVGLEPGSHVGHSLAEATIEDGLEEDEKLSSHSNVGHGHVVANEVLLALQVGIDDLHDILHLLQSVVVDI